MKTIVSLLFISLLILSSCKAKKLLEKISSEHSGIHFNNEVRDNDTLNVLDEENIYNGGGVGIGDFNGDGLPDIYFAGNMVENKLYLNKGDFKFQDITKDAGVAGEGKWSRGVAVVDINTDGLMDLYICATILKPGIKRANILYINQGLNDKGIPLFKNMAAEYGLADTSHSTMAAFFDYDQDGDLDMYLLNNEIIKSEYPNKFRPILKNSEHPNTDKLYRNLGNDSLGHPYFTDVSKTAGITIEGYGHGVNIADLNEDGWKDIYVTNDFVPNNLLYINNKNGTFTEKSAIYFKHTSVNAMGADIGDINNDGLPDIIEADMNPQDNYRKKMMLNANSYQNFQNFDNFGYQYQYVRNTLQLNQGFRIGENDSVGDPVFSEIAFYAGVAETDWSWTTLFADLDNDGYKDIFITNGFPKDVTDHDFIAYRNKAVSIASKSEILNEIPVVKIPNYIFKNNGDLTFSDKSEEWSENIPSFSNGTAYADLDSDGDLDWVINNINDEAFIYRNNASLKDESNNHHLQISFKADSLNLNGIGVKARVYYGGGKLQTFENNPYRGYLSSVQPIIHFGLGSYDQVDSIQILWPDGSHQLMINIRADQRITADIRNTETKPTYSPLTIHRESLFREVTTSGGFKYQHSETDYIDFNIQKLLHRKLSEFGPALAVGDADGNGTDDIIAGGSFQRNAQIFLQGAGGKFQQRNLFGKEEIAVSKRSEDMGILLFDADNDKDPDLYISSGGNESQPGTADYLDRFYLNDGKGNFTLASDAIPKILTSKSCVRAVDFDRDGDLDLFLAGRNDPQNYPKAVSSYILRNDIQDGNIRFTDVSREIAPELSNIGMICDAVFSDFNNDGWPDLILAGEWMPVLFFKNTNGKFTSVSDPGTAGKTGWWNSICPADVDNDGDMDYVLGNSGNNSFYRASQEYPVGIIAKDFDENGSFDAVPFLYIRESMKGNQRKEFPAHVRDDMIKQMISMRAKFPNYKNYAVATMDKVFSPEQRNDALKLQVTTTSSAVLINQGNESFLIRELPATAQFSMLNGMVSGDFNDDGFTDILCSTNDYGTEPSVGRYDALNGLVLTGNGKGDFKPLTILESGVFIPGNGKALVRLRTKEGEPMFAASQNRGPLKIFRLRNNTSALALKDDDFSMLIKYKNGTIRKEENYFGSSFLSQSGRFVMLSPAIQSVEITDVKGKKRIVENK